MKYSLTSLAPVAVFVGTVAGAPMVNGNCKVVADTSGAVVPGNGSFEAYTDPSGPLLQAAKQASAPAGYKTLFSKDIGASRQSGYLTYRLLDGPTYDVEQCAAHCNSHADCQSFNIFFERDPKFDHDANPGCEDMTPVTNVKCALFSEDLLTNKANNDKQYDGPNNTGFVNVQVGSSGYVKVSELESRPVSHYKGALQNYGSATELGNKAIKDDASYITYKSLNDPTFAVAECAKACTQQQGCVFFNTYTLLANGVSQGPKCALFNQASDASKAVNEGYGHLGDSYTIENSVSYALEQ
ncbi:hypothetical protein P280DRAFT_545287 [Massarina eburnea CBS 473.64]|uniref:Apple domain-containing protein n=1 Tax=Massarina eburnea CBS 473.64 TaxID=1395130 RepID=A0A6A6SFU8_9PLEO|nr:hypothetical protein P280DRAFT_545287 [Massarina eburnea CBS 473.64]